MADAAPSGEGGGGEEGINLQALTLEQLNQLKQQLEEVRGGHLSGARTARGIIARALLTRTPTPARPQEMQGLQAAMSQLKSSSEKLVNSKLALASLQQAAEGTRMLVPITSSLYVPGETTQLSNVLIDVGTGYYIEKSVDEAQAFLDRKIAMIKAQAGNVQQVASMKQQNLQGTVNVMNQKVMAAKQPAAAS